MNSLLENIKVKVKTLIDATFYGYINYYEETEHCSSSWDGDYELERVLWNDTETTVFQDNEEIMKLLYKKGSDEFRGGTYTVEDIEVVLEIEVRGNQCFYNGKDVTVHIFDWEREAIEEQLEKITINAYHNG